MNSTVTYLITIHNSEGLLQTTLDAVARVARPGSTIMPILDGCTDGSEAIVDEFVKTASVRVTKIKTPDVHELLTINAGLRSCPAGYIVVLQDDVILDEPDLETKILDLYDRLGPKLGVVSMRFADNLSSNPWQERIRYGFSPLIYELDLIGRREDAAVISAAHYGDEGQFYRRMVAIKGPNIIPPGVRRDVGVFDERLAPYGYDDADYCLRAMQSGFVNGFSPMKFKSDIDWGGTRKDKSFSAVSAGIRLRNRRYLWRKLGWQVRELWASGKVSRGPEPCTRIG